MNTARRTMTVVVTLLLVATATLVAASAAGAASPIDTSICHSTTSRLSIANAFPLSVCFDGSNLVVKNTTVLMVQINSAGTSGTWTRSAETTNAVSLTAAALDATPSSLPPGFQVTIPISSQATAFRLAVAPDENRLFWMQFVSSLIPSTAYGDYTAFSSFSDSMDSIDTSHQQCIKGATNFLEDAVCDAVTAADVVSTLQKLGNDLVLANFTKSNLLSSADKKFAGLVSLALTLVETDVSLFENNQQFADFLNAPKQILISAGPASAAPALVPWSGNGVSLQVPQGWTAAVSSNGGSTRTVYFGDPTQPGVNVTATINLCTGCIQQGSVTSGVHPPVSNPDGFVTYSITAVASDETRSVDVDVTVPPTLSAMATTILQSVQIQPETSAPTTTTTTTSPTAPTCDPAAFQNLMLNSVGQGFTLQWHACSGQWGLGAGMSDAGFGVSLFQFTGGAWTMLYPPDDGTCLAAASTAQCQFAVSTPIPAATIASMAQTAGLTVGPDGSVYSATP